MKKIVFTFLALFLLASSATSRERVFRAAPIRSVATTIPTQCSFVIKQMSGFRTKASGRNICYYDCQKSVTPTTIDSLTYCPQLVNVPLAALPIIARACKPGSRCR